MTFSVTQIDAPCGAIVEGLDLTKQLDDLQVKALRQEWLRSHVLIFPNQELSDDDLERYSLYFGHFGHDPFIAPIDGREHVAAVKRKAEEQAPVFAEVWHSDWSFQAVPPAGTCLYSITIPPIGGDTEYINQHKALTEMPAGPPEENRGQESHPLCPSRLLTGRILWKPRTGSRPKHAHYRLRRSKRHPAASNYSTSSGNRCRGTVWLFRIYYWHRGNERR